MKRTRLTLFAAALLLPAASVLVLTPAAHAQSTRTWVSGVGDDTNPCSRTAPCKTWAGAISRTAAGGEIDALDPGGFGSVTITHAITLSGTSEYGSSLVAGTNGIVVVAGANDVVTLRNLEIQGLNGQGLTGISYTSGKAVKVSNTVITGFQNGISASGACGSNSGSACSLTITGSHIENTTGSSGVGAALQVAPSSGTARVALTDSTIDGSIDGVDAGGGSGAAVVNLTRDAIDAATGNGISAASNATIRANGCMVIFNGTGVTSSGGGQVSSYLNNLVMDNTTNGSFTGTLSFS